MSEARAVIATCARRWRDTSSGRRTGPRVSALSGSAEGTAGQRMRLRDLLRVLLAGVFLALSRCLQSVAVWVLPAHLRPPPMVVVLAPEDEGQGTGERLH